MRRFWCAFAACVLLAASVSASASSSTDSRDSLHKREARRTGRLFPLFQIVRFSNDECNSTAGTQGTCYTSDECETRNGRSSGTCAHGYGVCCTFERGCGMSSSENCTVFSSAASTVTAGECSLEICPCSDNVCQLRLDFNQFTISGPTTVNAVIGNALCDELLIGAGGKLAPGRAVSNNGQCLTDSFVVTDPSGSPPPLICGVNSGQHLYVDADEACNDLVFQLGTAGVGTTLAQRNWNIKVTQYNCDFNNLAPMGCDQYFFGSSTATFQTYNFDGGEHLANQDQTFCFRREGNNCRICYTPSNDDDFQTSADLNLKLGGMGFNAPEACCNYGKDCADEVGFDCFEVPSAVNTANAKVPSRFCGRRLVTVNSGTDQKSVCSTSQPFLVRFNSDNFENTAEALNADRGFRLTGIQDTTGCP